MGKGDKLQKSAYVRYLSKNIRRWAPKPGVLFIEEDPVIGGVEGLARVVMLCTCRNRQRLLQQAWNYWTRNTDVVHDYTKDLVAILSNPLPENEMRTELEIEVMYKWVRQNFHDDFTSIAHNLNICKSKKAIIGVLQHARIESYKAGEPVLYQGTLPRIEDGHFTVLSGKCDVVQYPADSVSFVQLQRCYERKLFEKAKNMLMDCTVLVTMETNAGFGELSTLTGVKRAVTVRASLSSSHSLKLLVVPKPALMTCLEHTVKADDANDASPSEAIEVFRQTGLASRISPNDLMAAAMSMRKILLYAGDIIYSKGDPAKDLYIVVSGDVICDTADPRVIESQLNTDTRWLDTKNFKAEAFVNSNVEHSFHLSGGSILGDEGILGLDSTYVSTAAIASDVAVIFKAEGFAYKFLCDRVKAMRYAALAYKELPRWTVPIAEAESNNLYGNLNSLRRVIAFCRPARGVAENWHIREDDLKREHFSEVAPMIREIKKTKAQANRNHSKTDAANDEKREKEIALKKKRATMIAEMKKAKEEAKKIEAAKVKNKKSVRRVKKKINPYDTTMEANDGKVRDATGNILNVGNSNRPRLSFPALAAAKALNAASKKLQSDQVRKHARVNILQDQLLREANSDAEAKAVEEAARQEEENKAMMERLKFTSSKSMTSGPVQGSPGGQFTVRKPMTEKEQTKLIKQKQRLKQMSSISNKLNDALEMYQARQEEYISDDEEDDQIHLGVSAAANIMAMMQSAAAGAIAADDDRSSKTETHSQDDIVRESETVNFLSLVVTDSLRLTPEETDEDCLVRLEAIIKKKPIDQYFLHLERIRLANRSKLEIEALPEEFFDDAGDANKADGVKIAETANADMMDEMDRVLADAKDKEGFIEHKDGRTNAHDLWEGPGPAPSMINQSNWRPPSPPSRGGANELGDILVETMSRPTTRERPVVTPKSPWREVEKGTVLYEFERTHPKAANAKAGEEADLMSLRYDPSFYATHAQRMLNVESSGYGQKHIEAQAQKALGMSVQEFKEQNLFVRIPAPVNYRRIVLPEGIEKLLRPHVEKGSKNKKSMKMKQDTFHNMTRSTVASRANSGYFDEKMENQHSMYESSQWSVDLQSPHGFIQALEDKDFEVRKKYLEKYGWNTRAMKVSANSAHGGEVLDEVSDWFKQDALRIEKEERDKAAKGVHYVSPRKQRAVRRIEIAEEKELYGDDVQVIGLGDIHTDENESTNDVDGDSFNISANPTSPGHRQRLLTNTESVSGASDPSDDNDKGSSNGDRDNHGVAQLALNTAGMSFHSDISTNQSLTNGAASTSKPSTGRKRGGKEEIPSYHIHKPASDGLIKFQKALSREHNSRKFLDGKRKHNLNSHFKIPSAADNVNFLDSLLQLDDPKAKEADKDGELYQARGKTRALIKSLLPEYVPYSVAMEKSRRMQHSREESGSVGGLSHTQSEASAVGMGSPARKALESLISLDDPAVEEERQLREWQAFSVETVTKRKDGMHKTLPVLSLQASDPIRKPPKKSSLKYGGGLMERLPGKEELEFTPHVTYLDVFKANYKSKRRPRK
jgi:hypothetical protein